MAFSPYLFCSSGVRNARMPIPRVADLSRLSRFRTLRLLLGGLLLAGCSDSVIAPDQDEEENPDAEFDVLPLNLTSSDSLTLVDLNDAGQVLYRTKSAGRWQTRVWKDGRDGLVGELIGTDINNYGDIAGWWDNPEDRGFVLVDGNMRSIPAAFAPGFAINDHLHVAGWDRTHGLLWTGGEVQRLAEADCITYSRPVAINKSGQMVGYGGGCTSQHTLIWRVGRAEVLGAGTSGGGGTAINDRGFAVASSDGRGSSPTWGSIYSPEGERTDLGTLYPNPTPVEKWYGSGGKLERTLPADLNEANHVVGTATIPSGEGRGFLWREGKITDLSALVSGWTVTTAIRIDEQGRILAMAQRPPDGEPRPVLLVPRTTAAP